MLFGIPDLRSIGVLALSSLGDTPLGTPPNRQQEQQPWCATGLLSFRAESKNKRPYALFRVLV